MKKPLVQLALGSFYKKNPMMGHYIKQKYGSAAFTIGFTTYQGEFGLQGQTQVKKIKPTKAGSLEHLLNESQLDNYLLPLHGLNFKGYVSRPLGNYFMKGDIASYMDAVIFNRNMKFPSVDVGFFKKVYPNNRYYQKIAAPEYEKSTGEKLNPALPDSNEPKTAPKK